MECRIRDINYSGIIEVDFEVFKKDDNGFCKIVKNIKIGEIPIMIGSEYCWLKNMNNS